MLWSCIPAKIVPIARRNLTPMRSIAYFHGHRRTETDRRSPCRVVRASGRFLPASPPKRIGLRFGFRSGTFLPRRSLFQPVPAINVKDLRVSLFTGNYNTIPDGVSLTLNRWVRFLLEKEIPVLVFAPTGKEPQVAHAGEVVSVPSIPMPGRPEYRLTTGLLGRAQARLQAFKPTLIHMATPDFLGCRARRFSRANHIPLVASYHTHFVSYLKYYNLGLTETLAWTYLRWFYRHARHIYVPSPSIAEELARKGIVNHIRIWSRGVDVDLFSPAKRDLDWRQSQGIAPASPLITFVSRLVWEKDLQTVIETFNRLSAQLPEARILIVGDGPARQHLQRMVSDALFTGHLRGEALARAYASSDAFFFPSVTETFGNVTLEAMSSGLPAVVGNATGSRDLVEHGVNGFVLRPKEPAGFADHLCRLATQPDLRRKMGHASRQKALSYSWPRIHDGLLANYYQVLAGPDAASCEGLSPQDGHRAR